MQAREVAIPAGNVRLNGTLAPAGHGRLVLFAHGSGSSSRSPRNRYVAGELQAAGLGTLLFDLLTEDEELIDRVSAELRFDIGLLARRLEAATEWAVAERAGGDGLMVGYFGASTGAAAALIAASRLRDRVSAVVSRGGRPDLAGRFALEHVVSPTLLIVGELDREVMALNEQALSQLECEKDIVRVPRASHLFEEPGTLEEAARAATRWFVRWMPAR